MFKYTSKEIGRIADETSFNKNTCEKVLRLLSVLDFINHGELSGTLALKGGTAINLFMLDLPRLSVDIDLDFDLPLDRDGMLARRAEVDSLIRLFMENEGYRLSNKSRFAHTLDSYIFAYRIAPAATTY